MMSSVLPSASAWVMVAVGVSMPPLFSEESFEDARARAMREQKLFIVDATAVWCGPCKQMDRTTWVDPRVESWFDQHAIAVQVDVDEQEALARQLRIEAMPTVIVFKGETELDRVVGLQRADQLIGWLEGAKDGKSRADLLREKAGDRAGADGLVDVDARYELAGALAAANKHEEATDEYLWLWKHMVEFKPSMVGVRGSFMASDMKRLAAASEHARTAFTAVRDETEGKLKSPHPTWEDLGDWIVLNDVIGDHEATLAWIDRVAVDEEGWRTVRRFGYRVDQLLIERGRWRDYGMSLENPVGRARQDLYLVETTLSHNDRISEQDRERQMRDLRSRCIARLAFMHACLLKADRDEEAWQVAGLMQETPGAGRAIAEAALQVGVARERHLALLAAEEDGEILAKLREAAKAGGE